MSSSAATELRTERLRLRAPVPALGDAVVDFYRRNVTHFAPWDPPVANDHAAPDRVRQALADGAVAFGEGRSHRWWLLPADAPDRVIGSVHLSGISRGPFQNALLGYALDAAWQQRGLMGEALRAVIAEAFSPRVHLHRLQAAVQPGNARSLAVLRQLGFREEGLALDYLFIAGAWRDHLLFALTHPGFRAPEGW